MKIRTHIEGAGIFVWAPIICIVFWLWLFVGCKTTTYNHTKQDTVDPRVTVHYDKNGKVQGTSKQSPIDPRVTIYRKKK